MTHLCDTKTNEVAGESVKEHTHHVKFADSIHNVTGGLAHAAES